ncbi:transcriptional regulator [Paeniglutamicibacter cryotolerans]|uniref:DNA-binding MarR family transcriptional regulator n=1 Tax=Paeniglutamicibacter cryotolerans TaxID=670079 RepID=A0A839QGK2_9MICC|nr:transcriptional regulator [Paeniglutamicibacter cryotolerans]MBB2995468.1 DNA-binding MarR family transcriptional regulator [Paeniglutamicibacter cryotolerans]
MTPSDPPGFNALIHAPQRLRICAALLPVREIEFSALRDGLAVADSVLSKHLRVLDEAGYIRLSKPTGRGRARTWVSITASGRTAVLKHLDALRAMLGDVGA